jgi:hypothetical protein
MKSEISPAKQLSLFLHRFSPDIVKLAKAARAKLRKRLPGAVEMVYDNYNALVIGFSPTDRPSDAILSIVIWPRKVSICFIQGKHLPDPDDLLQGDGNQVRFIRLDAGAAILDTVPIRTLIDEAIAFGDEPFNGKARLVSRSISAKQRPRR